MEKIFIRFAVGTIESDLIPTRAAELDGNVMIQIRNLQGLFRTNTEYCIPIT